MIDWLNLFSNSLWILGLALALATLSYASWEASLHKEKFRSRLNRAPIQAALSLAGVLFCAGLAATSDSTLEIVLWAALAAAFAAQIVVLGVQGRRKT
jgi:hypothetical protein